MSNNYNTRKTKNTNNNNNNKFKNDHRKDPTIDAKILDNHASKIVSTHPLLSRQQVIKSLEKAYQWKLRSDRTFNKVMPVEALNADMDPAIFVDPSLISPIQQNQNQMPDENVLVGSDFERGIFECNPLDEKRDITIREWLKKREEKLQERDHLKKWLRSWQEQQDTSTEELIKMWQKKRREYSYAEWIEISQMEDNLKLNCNQLLSLYRKETAPVKMNKRIDTGSIQNQVYENESNLSSGVIKSTTVLIGSTQVSSPRTGHTRQKNDPL